MSKVIKTILKGVGAGASISLGSILFVLASAFIKDGKPLGALLFSVGLLLVCFLGFNLYTGKIGFLLDQKNKKNYAIQLCIMLLLNTLTAFLVGFLFNLIFKNNVEVVNKLTSIYQTKTNQSWIKTLFSSMFCGCFVYSAVYFFKNCKYKLFKAFGIIISVFLFVDMGYDHCIANSFYFAAANELGNFKTYLSLLISIIGNSIGAILLNQFISRK